LFNPGGGVGEPALSAERIAAFLDGRLSAEEREVVLAQLAADPEWREVAIDAAAVREDVGDVNGNSARPSLSVSRPATATKWLPWVAVAAAACVTVFVIMRGDGPVADGESVALVAPVQALAMTVTPEDASGLTRERWPVVRAGAATIDHTTRAVRLGALSVDALLDRAGQGAEAREQMVELLQPLNAAVVRRLITEARDSASFVMAFDAARQVVSADAFDVGVWLELLRAGSESARGATGMIERLRRVVAAKQLSPEQAAELTAHVRRLEEQLRSSAGNQLQESATVVLQVLAS
jgi:hypothetical protein